MLYEANVGELKFLTVWMRSQTYLQIDHVRNSHIFFALTKKLPSVFMMEIIIKF